MKHVALLLLCIFPLMLQGQIKMAVTEKGVFYVVPEHRAQKLADLASLGLYSERLLKNREAQIISLNAEVSLLDDHLSVCHESLKDTGTLLEEESERNKKLNAALKEEREKSRNNFYKYVAAFLGGATLAAIIIK